MNTPCAYKAAFSPKSRPSVSRLTKGARKCRRRGRVVAGGVGRWGRGTGGKTWRRLCEPKDVETTGPCDPRTCCPCRQDVVAAYAAYA